METAGAKDMPEDAERRGLGTPATRASILEKLVSTGFVERKKAKKTVNLLPTQIGVSLVTVLPEQLQLPQHGGDAVHELPRVQGPALNLLEPVFPLGGTGTAPNRKCAGDRRVPRRRLTAGSCRRHSWRTGGK